MADGAPGPRDIRDFLKLVVDPIRLAVLGRAAEGPVDQEHLADSLGVPERRVREAVVRLRAAALLTETLELDRRTLRGFASDLPRPAPPDPEVTGVGTWTEVEAEVLARFFSGRRLVDIPAARSKRLVVLERLAQEFEPGLRYPEAEVNFTLQLWHADFAALRRYLVDEGLLTRADGVYWRTGGRYEAPADDDG
jgi:hypothetical protein